MECVVHESTLTLNLTLEHEMLSLVQRFNDVWGPFVKVRLPTHLDLLYVHSIQLFVGFDLLQSIVQSLKQRNFASEMLTEVLLRCVHFMSS